MMNVCYQCGLYRADKEIDPSGPFAVCPECGYKHPFKRLPLLIVSGASGTGKSAVCQRLLGTIHGAVLLDSDILWRTEYNTPGNNYRDFFELWLRICKNIAQSGRPVVLFGAGMGVPENIEPCIERRYFSQVHYLALVCADEVLAERLKDRPAWRGTRTPEYIQEHAWFNNWFRSYAGDPPMTRLDTTSATLEETARQAAAWIEETIKAA
jgi:hypothetical protein